MDRPTPASGPEHAERPPLPGATRVVVVGGGVAGVSTALFLAEWGVPVVLCEKGRVAGEQSSRNWGWIRRQGRDPRELPLMLESLALWRRLASELDEDIGFRQAGCTYLCATDEELATREAWLAHARAFQIGSRMLSSAEVDSLLGQSARRFGGALHTPDDAQAEPGLAVPALARRAAALGAVVAENTAVRGVIRAGGRISGVVTEHGPIACEAVVLAGGVWSRTFMENLGLDLPQLAIRSSVIRTGPAPEIAPGAIGATGASIRRRADGGYTIGRTGAAQFEIVPAAFRHLRAFLPVLKKRWRIVDMRVGASFFGPLGRKRWSNDEASPFETLRVYDPAPNERLLDDVMTSARDLFPQLADAAPVQRWAGLIDVTPDEVPVIDTVPEVPGLVLATGLSGHGFGLGPGVGLLAAQMATGRTPCVDPSHYALSRFSGQRVGAARPEATAERAA